MEIFEKIRELRIQKGVKQIDIAAYLGISQSAYTNYENGKRRLNYEFIIKLADFYHVTLDELFQRTTNKKISEVKEMNFKSKIHKEIWRKLNSLREDDLYIVDGYLDGLLERTKIQENRKDKIIG